MKYSFLFTLASLFLFSSVFADGLSTLISHPVTASCKNFVSQKLPSTYKAVSNPQVFSNLMRNQKIRGSFLQTYFSNMDMNSHRWLSTDMQNATSTIETETDKGEGRIYISFFSDNKISSEEKHIQFVRKALFNTRTKDLAAIHGLDFTSFSASLVSRDLDFVHHLRLNNCPNGAHYRHRYVSENADFSKLGFDLSSIEQWDIILGRSKNLSHRAARLLISDPVLLDALNLISDLFPAACGV